MSDDAVYPMCPACRAADVQVLMAKEVRDPCPHCGSELAAALRVCCIPDCSDIIPNNRDIPLCRPCGVKVALFHFEDASMLHSLHAERRRQKARREDERKTAAAANSVVYYVRLDAERIKIGYTTQLQKRLGGLRVDPQALMACEPGGRPLESRRHRQFAAERIRSGREDFRPSEKLLEWITAVREEHGLPAWAVARPDTKTVTVRRVS